MKFRCGRALLSGIALLTALVAQGAENGSYFVIDGVGDGKGYSIGTGAWGDFRAAKSGDELYLAFPSSLLDDGQVFVFLSDKISEPVPAPWGGNGLVYFDTEKGLWWEVSKTSTTVTGQGGEKFSSGGDFWETSVNLRKAFGGIPTHVYLFAARTAPNVQTGKPVLVSQFPGGWDADPSLQPYEFRRMPMASIEDADGDGYFDAGKPVMQVSKDGEHFKDANYGLVRYYIDELAGEKAKLFVRFKPNVPGRARSVELFSNVNRRDFVVLEPEKQAVVADVKDHAYFAATTMEGPDKDGWYIKELDINKCGAYRLQARYKTEGGRGYLYYTDGVLRRDCAVVVSPTKSKDIRIYETNPMIAGATDDSFEGRGTLRDLAAGGKSAPKKMLEAVWGKKSPVQMDRQFYQTLGVNSIWIQPIHPIGTKNAGINPETGKPFVPGSPYSVSDYWSVNPILGRDNSAEGAMEEFRRAVGKLDEWGVGVFMDGTFNHCAVDAVMGEGAALIGLQKLSHKTIAEVRPQWFAKTGEPRRPAGNAEEISSAPDRFDFPSWNDSGELYYGSYDALAFEKRYRHPLTGFWGASGAFQTYLGDGDTFHGHTAYTKELWEYMSNYPIYWLAKTGHPKGTPAKKSHLGIDGLRCDFAQGLPPQFWEYCINKTRKVKWDFVFMAESLDGVWRTLDGKPRGVGYRSARHFDVLNENICFYWRDSFFGYPVKPGQDPVGRRSTHLTKAAYTERQNDMDHPVILGNLTSHDEIYPHNDEWAIAYAYAQIAAMPGAPMIFNGQEVGGQNYKTKYGFTEKKFGPISPERNFDVYERNLGKYIPNFKVYNSMRKIWEGAGEFQALRSFYGAVNRFRSSSKALSGGDFLFLNHWGRDEVNDQIFAVARAEKPHDQSGKSEVVIAVVNNDYVANPDASGPFSFNLPRRKGVHWAGVDVGKLYMLQNQLSEEGPKDYWDSAKTGLELLSQPLWFTFPIDGKHAAYFRLVEVGTEVRAEAEKPAKSTAKAKKGRPTDND